MLGQYFESCFLFAAKYKLFLVLIKVKKFIQKIELQVKLLANFNRRLFLDFPTLNYSYCVSRGIDSKEE